MVAGLETYKSEVSFVSAKVDAWHRMGNVLDECFDAKTAMEKAHLAGWNVHKEPLMTISGLLLPDAYASVRTNPYTQQSEPLGKVGKIWTPLQNEETADFLDTLVDESGAHYETAGSLHGGRDVFLTMKLPKHIEVGGVDTLNLYIAALNNHSGDATFRTLFTITRIECANTQAAALRNAVRIAKIRHTRNAQQRVQEVRETLGMTFKYMDAFEAEANRMIEQSYTDAQFAALVETILPDVDEDSSARALTWHGNAEETLTRLFVESPTNTAIRGTRWAAYQAVTEWTDHFYPVRGENTDEKRALRTLEGRNDETKELAWALLAS